MLTALTATQIRTAAPAVIDEHLADAMRRRAAALDSRESVARRIEVLTGSKASRPSLWTTYDQEQLDKALAAREHAASVIEATGTVILDLSAEYAHRPWSRGWLAVTSSNGHVHRGEECGQLFREFGVVTTRLELKWELSGMDEAEIVDRAGSRACTVCYPSAPVHVLRQQTRVLSEDEHVRAAARLAREERAAAQAAAKAAKAITAPDGTPLRGRHGNVVETETAAQQEYCGILAELDWITPESEAVYNPRWRADRQADAQRLLEGLAHKNGETAEAAKKRLAPKVAAKLRRDLAEIAKWEKNRAS